ncbi:MAG: phage portal protein, partial [Gammaproteobacteria bacterium]
MSTAYDDSPTIGVDSALQVSTVWACVSLLVENVASLPLVVYQVGIDGQRSAAKGTRLYSIFHDSPNKRQTSLEFWEFMMLNFVLRGNA